jgi:hypothetical protein
MSAILLLLIASGIAIFVGGGGAVVLYRAWRSRLYRYLNNNDARFTALGLALGNLHKQCDGEFAAIRHLLAQLQHDVAAGVATQRLSEHTIMKMQHQLAGLNLRCGIVTPASEILLGDLDTYFRLDQAWESVRDTSRKVRTTTRVDGDRARTAILVTLGQSNAANHGSGKYVAQHRVDNFNLYDGQCYHAADPLLSASGEGGNFATRLGDKLIEADLFDRVILAPIAMGGTIVEQWAEEGVFNRRILALIKRLHSAALKPDFILWHQGEGNSGLADENGRQYRKNLLEVVGTFRRYGIDAPFLVALATWCGGRPHPNAENIRAGQQGAVNPMLGVYLGPDTDTIGPEHRWDSCHFSETGLDLAASLWLKAIADQMQSASPAERRRPSLRTIAEAPPRIAAG